MAETNPTISDDFVVDIQVSREDLATGIEGFGVLNIVGSTNVIRQDELIRFYVSLIEVGNDFSPSSQEFIAAQDFFAQAPRAATLAISRRITTDLPGFAISAEVTALLTAFQAVSDGEFRVSVDADQQDILALDFTLDSSFNDVAATIQTGLQAIGTGGYTASTCAFNVTTNQFTITSGTTGAASSVSLLSTVPAGLGTDISGAAFMNMQVGEVVPGVTAGLTVVDQVQQIIDKNDQWYGLMFTSEMRVPADVLAVAQFVEGLFKFFGTTSNDEDVLDSGSSTDIISQLQTANLSRTFAFYSSFFPGSPLVSTEFEYPEASYFSRFLAVDFTALDSTLTMAFKNLPDISVERLTSNDVDTIKNKGGNVFVSIGNRNVTFNGQQVDGEFTDIIHGVDWLTATMRDGIFDLLVNTPTKIPFTDTGIQQVVNEVRKVLDAAIVNGLISSNLGDDGKAIPAFTITSIRKIDLPPADIAARKLTGISFIGRLSGAIHSVEVTGLVTVFG